MKIKNENWIKRIIESPSVEIYRSIIFSENHFFLRVSSTCLFRKYFPATESAARETQVEKDRRKK